MEKYLEKGYHLFTDNFYNSVSLTEHMSRKKITGTLRADRKRKPKQVISAKLKKGEMKWLSLGDVTVAKWKDKRDVRVISNAHTPEMVAVSNQRGVVRQKPNIVRDYNQGMSGIDR